MALVLTPEEQAELQVRPISLGWQNFTKEQLRLRKEIGKKIWDNLVQMDTEMPDWAKQGYEKCPPWAFFTDASNIPIRRVYGVMGDNHMHAVSAMMAFNNDVIGGIPCDELTQIDDWDDHMKNKLQLTPTPGLFLDPLGFIEFIRAHAK